MDLERIVSTPWGLVPVALVWVAAIAKVPAWTGRRFDAGVAAVVLMLVTLAASMTLAIPAIYYGLDAAAGIPNLARLLSDLLALAAVFFLREFLVSAETDPAVRAVARRRGRWLAQGAGAALVGLFFVDPIEVETVSDMIFYGGWSFFAYRHVYLLTLAAGLLDALRRSQQIRSRTARPSIRASLRLLQVGQVLGLVQVASNLVEVGIHAYGDGLSARLYGEAQVLVSFLAVVVAASVTVVSILTDRYLPGLARRWRARQAHRRLRRLWTELVRSVPDVVLPGSSGDRLDPTGLLDIDRRLYRRIVEIRDAYLVLRSSVPAEAAATVTRLVPPGDDHDVVVEAALLHVAIAARRAGATGGPRAGTLLIGGGSTIEEEAAWLTAVAAAHRTSPVVARVARAAVEGLHHHQRRDPTGITGR